MTIEKQINILVGERVKLLDLEIKNPPESFKTDVADEEEELPVALLQTIPDSKKAVKKARPSEKEEARPAPAPAPKRKITIPDDDDIPMLTQDQIDAKFHSMKNEEKQKAPEQEMPNTLPDEETPLDDTSIKLLDVALEKGSLNKKVMDREKKVRFFRENFPSD